MHSLLFVDDEKAILKSLNRLFFDKGLFLFFAEDGKKALEIFRHNKIDMVITDVRMPEMNGYTLLREVQKLYPETLRVIFSGQSSEEEIYKAVFDGAVSIYMLKPWEPQRLIDFVLNTFRLSDDMKAKDIFNKLEKLRLLPVGEEVWKEMEQLESKDKGMQRLTESIGNDLGACARILKFMSSSFFDIKVGSIKQAASYLDSSTMRQILSNPAGSNVQVLSAKEQSNFELIQEQAKLTYKIVGLIYSKIIEKPTPEVALSAAILHNIGMILSFDAEMNRADCDEISGFILGWWQLPPQIIESAIYRSSPFLASSEYKEIVCVIHLADYYAWKHLNKNFGELEQKAFEVIGTNQMEFESNI